MMTNTSWDGLSESEGRRAEGEEIKRKQAEKEGLTDSAQGAKREDLDEGERQGW